MFSFRSKRREHKTKGTGTFSLFPTVQEKEVACRWAGEKRENRGFILQDEVSDCQPS